MQEFEVRKLICEIGKRVYQNGFVAANDGNISVKISENEVLCTPTGVSKGYMTPDMICKVNMKGEVIQSAGKYKPSSEIRMHLRVYQCRPDVKSVVHAHPPYATSYAIAGIPLDKPIMPEAVIALGNVPIAAYGTPSTDEIPDAVQQYLDCYDAVLLENHGALSYADDLMSAYFKMESLEFYAKLSFISHSLGGAKELNHSQYKKLIELRQNMNISGKHPAVDCAGNKTNGMCSCNSEIEQPKASTDAYSDSLVSEITQRVLMAMKTGR